MGVEIPAGYQWMPDDAPAKAGEATSQPSVSLPDGYQWMPDEPPSMASAAWTGAKDWGGFGIGTTPEEIAAAKAAHPIAYGAGAAGSVVAPMVLTGGASTAAQAAARAPALVKGLSTAARWALVPTAGKTVLGTAGNATRVGAITGAANAAGHADYSDLDTLRERLDRAAKFAVPGAVIGGAVPLAIGSGSVGSRIATHVPVMGAFARPVDWLGEHVANGPLGRVLQTRGFGTGLMEPHEMEGQQR